MSSDIDVRQAELAKVVGSRLRLYLRRGGDVRTGAQLAKAAGVSRSAASLWLTGARLPSAAALVCLSSALDVSTDWLLGIDRGGPRRRSSLTPANTPAPPSHESQNPS